MPSRNKLEKFIDSDGIIKDWYPPTKEQVEAAYLELARFHKYRLLVPHMKHPFPIPENYDVELPPGWQT